MVKLQRAGLIFAVLLPACGGGGDAPAAPAALSPPIGTPAPPPAAPPPPPPPDSSPPSVTTASTTADCPAAAGRVLSVGPGKQFTTVRAAAAAAQTGDTIHIAAGDYRRDVTTWHASNLTICGIGGRARLLADGAHEGGKGIWVIRGASTTVVNVEFHGAKVPDENGAGIRQEGRNLTLRNTAFFDNENGILTDDDSGSTITIEGSEFARNGFGDGYTHNIYVGKIGRLHVRTSLFREAKIGHQLKTRARENIIEHSYFIDGPDGTSSYLLNFDNGGRAVVRGNLLQKGPKADNSILITHYTNVWGSEFNSLTLEHNTVVSTYPGGRFLDVRTEAVVDLTANIFAGTGSPTLISGGTARTRDNFVTTASEFPGATHTTRPDFWPNAALLSRLALGSVPVPDYAADAPRPFMTRALSGSTRLIGALQAAP